MEHLFGYETGMWGSAQSVRFAADIAVYIAVMAAVIFLQYRRRATPVSRGVLSAGLLVLVIGLPGWRLAFAFLQMLHGPGASGSVQIAFDAVRSPQVSPGGWSNATTYDAVGVRIPIAITGIPTGAGIVAERVRTTIDAPGGAHWDSGWRFVGGIVGRGELQAGQRLITARNDYWLELNVDSSFYDSAKLRQAPVRVRSTAAFTTLSAPRIARMPIPSTAHPMGQGNLCSVSIPDGIQLAITCLSGVRRRFDRCHICLDRRAAHGQNRHGAECSWTFGLDHFLFHHHLSRLGRTHSQRPGARVFCASDHGGDREAKHHRLFRTQLDDRQHSLGILRSRPLWSKESGMVTMRKIAVLARKDLRYIWPHLLAVLPLMFVFATSDLDLLTRNRSVLVTTGWQLLFLATPVAIWSLVTALIHGEPLVGDRQYWLTRPFTWYHLAAAKWIVLAICINLPLFLFQAIALGAAGISPVAYLPDLLWRQLFFSVFLLLPIAALAAITRTQGQVALVFLLVAGPFAAWAWLAGNGQYLLAASPFAGWGWLSGHGQYIIGGAQWIDACAIAVILCAGSCAILLLQYSQRRAALSRFLLALTALLCIGYMMVPQQAVYGALVSGANMRLSLDRTVKYPAGDWRYRRTEAIELPLSAKGLPSDSELTLNDYRIAVDSPEVPGFRTEVNFVRLHGWSGQAGFLQIVLDPKTSKLLSGHELTIRGRIYLTLMRRAQVLDTAPRTLDIPGFGVCNRDRALCLSPAPHASLSFIFEPGEQRPGRYGRIVPLSDACAPLPVSPWLYPLDSYHYEPSESFLLVERPAGRFLFDFNFQHLRLEDFARPY